MPCAMMDVTSWPKLDHDAPLVAVSNPNHGSSWGHRYVYHHDTTTEERHVYYYSTHNHSDIELDLARYDSTCDYNQQREGYERRPGVVSLDRELPTGADMFKQVPLLFLSCACLQLLWHHQRPRNSTAAVAIAPLISGSGSIDFRSHSRRPRPRPRPRLARASRWTGCMSGATR